MDGNVSSLERERDSSLVFFALKATSQLFPHFSTLSKSLFSETPASQREVLEELGETQLGLNHQHTWRAETKLYRTDH